MLKMGVIGLGAMGQHHVRLYSQFQNSVSSTSNPSLPTQVELVGVADVNPKTAEEIGKKYNVPYFTDYHDLISKVDAVSIAVPTTLHYVVAMDCMNAIIHCLVEKPIASRFDQAQEMVQAAAKNKVNLAIGHIERFNPAVLKLKQIIDAGSLGQVLILSTRRVGPTVPRIRDVGVIIDSATHDISVVKYLIGKNPICVYSKVGSLKHTKEDHAIIILDFETPTACIEVNWFTPHKVRTLVATGSEGIAYLDYIEQKVVVHNSQAVEAPDIQKEEPLKLELEDFINSIISGKAPSVDGQEGLEVLQIALEASSNDRHTSQLVIHQLTRK
jgi:UDP-N-acetylglucosamine 3-dehydrogenase